MATPKSTNAGGAFDNARQELRTNARLRIGLYLILAVFWLYGLLVLRDQIARDRETWQSVESRIARAKSTAATADWTSRAQDVKSSLAEYERLIWREGSVGISQATLQEWLQRSFAASGVIVRATQVSAQDAAMVVGAAGTADTSAANPANPIGDLVAIRVRAQVEFRPQSFYAWLLSLNRDRVEKRPTVAIESLTIRAGQPAIGNPGSARGTAGAAR
jgi:hypothetical protein